MAEVVGSIGVGILLGVFILNLIGRMDSGSRPYAAANAVGAGIACAASLMIGFYPFVVLEGVWFIAAVTSLVRQTGAP